STSGCSAVSESWWMFDQVEPTLLIYTVWSAIDLVPSWTKKINPRASDNRPTNRRTKRIMAFYAQRNMYRPAIAYPARAPRSIGSDDLPLGASRGRRPRCGAGGASQRLLGILWRSRARGTFVPGPL